MTSHSLQNFITDTVSELREGLNPEAIYVFGSRARGTATENSDVDFLVVVRDSNLPRHRRAQEARKIATQHQFSKDIVVLTQAEWNQGLRVTGSLSDTVAHEGICLHER